MRRHHYLGFSHTVGRALRHVAEYQGQWVALLLWQASALKCAPRDRWINWSRPVQFQRLHLVANNARFLVLSNGRVPHLASRVLGLSLRRLSADWQAIHGFPLLLAETFVDSSRFRGTCYQASNWRCLGETCGYARYAGNYRHHGHRKTIWVYPLHHQSCQRLRHPFPDTAWAHAIHSVELTDLEMERLHSHLCRLPEPRNGRRQLHPLATVLAIVLSAIMAGARGYLEVSVYASHLSQSRLKRLRAYFDQRKQCFIAPAESTFRRVLQQVNFEAFEDAIFSWLEIDTSAKNPPVKVAKSCGIREFLMSARLGGMRDA